MERLRELRLSVRSRRRAALYGIVDALYGSGEAVGASIWLRERKLGETGMYLGIVCDTNEQVDAAHAAAVSAGATDEGAPADRTYFAPGYYAANVADFDGNRLEFVHKAWNPNQHGQRSSDWPPADEG